MLNRWLTLALVLSSVANYSCNGDNDPEQTATTGAHPRETASSPPGIETGSPLTITLSNPPASTFETRTDQPQGPGPAGQLARRFPAVGLDPCLWRAAEGYAEAASRTSGELPLAFTEFVLHWGGCPDPTAAVSTLFTDADGEKPLLDHVARVLSEDQFTHLGVYRIEGTEYRWRWYVVLVKRSMELRPVPAMAELGQRLPLQFRVDERFQAASIHSTSPRGSMERTEVGLSGGWAIAVIELPEEVGQQWIELLAEGDRGPEVLALFPVEIGRSPPTIWIGKSNPDESWITTNEQAEARALELINRDRATFGLLALEHDPRLDDIARGHSEDMVSADYFAHVSPTRGDISDRLRSEGFPTRLAMENLAKSPTMESAQEGLMRSPGHRAAILDPDVTHVGVGVVRDQSNGMYLVTQIFTQPLAHSSPEVLEHDLENLVRQARDHLSAPTLFHPDLASTARYVARILVAEDIEAAAFEELVADRMALTLGGGRSWTVVAGNCHTAEDVELPESLANPEVDLIGVGAAGPMSTDPSEPSQFVILMAY